MQEFSSDTVQRLSERLKLMCQSRAKVNGQTITDEDISTVMGVFNRPVFTNYLAATQYDEAMACIAQILEGERAGDGFDKLRKLCMGVWLENCSSFAISDEGKMLVKCDGKQVVFDDVFQEHLDDKSDEASTYYRQAALRQIERYYVMAANGLFEEQFRPKRIADIGSGTLIASVMMHDRLPDAHIDAYEPGLISPKSTAIAQKTGITLHASEFHADEASPKYDLIMLHFVLEHDEAQARELIRNALHMLAPGGKISISVPNYNAHHREQELLLKMNKRDPNTRLSAHDVLSGHQIIFTPEQLAAMIEEIKKEENLEIPLQMQTILPRPFAFNTMIGLSKDDTLLDTLEREGHPKGLQQQGSVIAISLGAPSQYRTHLSDKPPSEMPAFSGLVEAHKASMGRKKTD